MTLSAPGIPPSSRGRFFPPLAAVGLGLALNGCLGDLFGSDDGSGDEDPVAMTAFFLQPGEAVFRSTVSRASTSNVPGGVMTIHDICDIRVRSQASTDDAMLPSDTLYRAQIDSTCHTGSDTTKRATRVTYVVKRGDTASYLWDAMSNRFNGRAPWPFEIHARPASETRRVALNGDSVRAWGRGTPPQGNTQKWDELLIEGMGVARSGFKNFILQGGPQTGHSLNLVSRDSVPVNFTCDFYAPDACPF